MSVTRLSDPDDPRAADFARLTDVDYRRSREAEHGVFVAESRLVIERALETGHRVRRVLCAERWQEPVVEMLDRHGCDAEILVADDALLRSIAGYRVHRGALASVERPAPLSVDAVAGAGRLVAVLDDLVDHTNVGAIARSAVAMGAAGLLVSPRCADPLYRRSVRVSMGAVLAVPWARAERWPGDLARLREHGFTVLGLTPEGEQPLERVDPAPGDHVALVVGAEAAGLSPEARSQCDALVRIGMAVSAAYVDSLNAAAASAVAFHHVGVRLGLVEGDSR